MASNKPKTNEIKKNQALKVKRHMKRALEDYQTKLMNDELFKTKWPTDPKTGEIVMPNVKKGNDLVNICYILAEEIMQDFPGYEISWRTVQSHFEETNEPPLFLIQWYANKFGISIDSFLTGRTNTMISNAEHPLQALDEFRSISLGLINELGSTIYDQLYGETEREAFYQMQKEGEHSAKD